MKKSLLIAGLLLAGTTGAWAQVFTDIHTPYHWLGMSVSRAVDVLHNKHDELGQYLYTNVFNKADTVFLSAAELCDEYEAACRVHKITAEPCTKFIATVADEHNKVLSHYTSHPKDRLSWSAPDKVANFECMDLSTLCESVYYPRDGELFKACENMTDSIKKQECTDLFGTVRMSSREFYNICTKVYPEVLLEDNKYNKQHACYELTVALINRVNKAAKDAEDKLDQYRMTLPRSLQIH